MSTNRAKSTDSLITNNESESGSDSLIYNEADRFEFVRNVLSNPLQELPEFSKVVRNVRDEDGPVSIFGLVDAQKTHFISAILNKTKKRSFFITQNEYSAQKTYEEFYALYGDAAVFFPVREVVLFDIEARNYDIVFKRLKALDRILRNDYQVAVASIEAVTQILLPPQTFEAMKLPVSIGCELDLPTVERQLVEMGYEHAAAVESRGTFAVRGGILDIYPVDFEYAVRIELFDNEIDSIRLFDKETQRSIETISNICIIPAREIIFPKNAVDVIQRRIIEAQQKEAVPMPPAIISDLEKFEQMHYFPGLDRYLPYIYDPITTILNYICDDKTIIVLDEPVRAQNKLEVSVLEHVETCQALIEKGKLLKDVLYKLSLDFYRLLTDIPSKRLLTFSAFDSSKESEIIVPQISYTVLGKTAISYQGNVELLKTDIREKLADDWIIILVLKSTIRIERLFEMLVSEKIPVKKMTSSKEQSPEKGIVNILKGNQLSDFEYPKIKLMVLSETELQGADKYKKRKTKVAKGSKIEYFTDLSIGDFVVHQSHGVGIYTGLEQLKVENVIRDYLKIKYKDGDFLYIPTNQLDLVQKYIGSEAKAPKINSLNGSEWMKTKRKVKDSLKKLAEQLILIYAKRRSAKGFEFSKDTVWQRQFEELFPYEETDDQLRSIEEIKEDMESNRLMDRLLCGDVGFGKTEVAIRAVFKAVNDGKQVAFLVPTTVLAQQHYSTFKDRFQEFPVTVDVLSRFRTKKEQTKISEGLKQGNIDVIIGTHRLLHRDIAFKDLGLLVVDEEQRFGVSHKEKLKNLKPDIDVLSLSATPIPRTLHMSMTKIRDISVLKDPPEERFPVQTFVMEYDEDVIRDAILREVSRKGQVFYLYNKVRGIDIKTMQLHNLLPKEIRIAFAHGQMGNRELEDVMFAFINHEYDVLVCTTIIESGLDMPNVNTLVVEDADRMGLAQLYQLRGRVGRSNRLAYAYITHGRDKIVSEEAEKRLRAIREFTELGSGFKIAMRDMEIRGIGNLLGVEQHGHMESVGYDMYCRLLDEAVRELEQDNNQAPETGIGNEVNIDINISAYIDSSYIGDETQRLEMYQKIASIGSDEDAMDVTDELIDRFSELPEAVKNIIDVSKIKVRARKCGFSSVSEKNDVITLQLDKNRRFEIEKLSPLFNKYKRQVMLNAGVTPYIQLKPVLQKGEDVLTFILMFLDDFILS